MSWFRSAFVICIPEPGSYYTAINPVDFYEWKFKKKIPKGTLFTSYLPPSDIFTKGKIIASAIIPVNNLKSLGQGNYRVLSDIQTDVVLKIGYMPSPEELINKYKIAYDNINRGLNRFKEDIVTREFVCSKDKKPKLLRVSSYSKKEITFDNFGNLEDLIEKFTATREALMYKTTKKDGRSYEMKEFRRYENAMTFINNSHLYVDSSKMHQLIKSSNIKPIDTQTVPWREFYLQTSQEATDKYNIIKHFESKKWFQSVWKIMK